MKQEQLHRTPETLESPPPVRRLGTAPTHYRCHCPNSFDPVIVFNDQGFAVKIDPKTLVKDEVERATLTNRVQDVVNGDGSGGLAPYEDFAVVKRGDLARSLAFAAIQAGAEILPHGVGIQEPLFDSPDPRPLLRWDVNLPN